MFENSFLFTFFPRKLNIEIDMETFFSMYYSIITSFLESVYVNVCCWSWDQWGREAHFMKVCLHKPNVTCYYTAIHVLVKFLSHYEGKIYFLNKHIFFTVEIFSFICFTGLVVAMTYNTNPYIIIVFSSRKYFYWHLLL